MLRTSRLRLHEQGRALLFSPPGTATGLELVRHMECTSIWSGSCPMFTIASTPPTIVGLFGQDPTVEVDPPVPEVVCQGHVHAASKVGLLEAFAVGGPEQCDGAIENVNAGMPSRVVESPSFLSPSTSCSHAVRSSAAALCRACRKAAIAASAMFSRGHQSKRRSRDRASDRN